MKAYISGPMTDRPEFNFPTFDEVAVAWRAAGNEAISPAEHDRAELAAKGMVLEQAPGYAEGNVPVFAAATGFEYAVAMAWDMQAVIDSDAIVMLPDWEKSSGARAERFVAEMTGKTVFLAWKYGTGWVIMPDIEQKRLAVSVIEHAVA